MSIFENLGARPEDPIFGLMREFKEDARPDKMNLSIGIYMDESLSTPVVEAAYLAEKKLLEQRESKRYLPIMGCPDFIQAVKELIFGVTFAKDKRIIGAQALGGTGALSIATKLLKIAGVKTIAISDPTWVNHRNLIEDALLNSSEYPYHDRKNNRLAFDELIKFLKECAEGTVILLHAVCHNPTGIDPTTEQWKEISQLMLKRKLIPLFDCAYQGFGRGLAEDVESIKLFIDDGHELFVCYSFSKNMGLYCERVGAFFAVCKEEKKAEDVASQVERIIRGNYSNPPRHGGRIASTILLDKTLRALWETELTQMRNRMIAMRSALIAELAALNIDLSSIKNQYGMFCLLNISPNHVEMLREKKAIYVTRKGRISFSGLTAKRAKFLAQAIHEMKNLENAQQ